MQSYRGSITGGTVQGASERRAGPPVRRFGRLATRWLTAAALLPLAPGVAAQAAPRPRPRLVVVIAVDQLRADYIERFRPFFGAGGFNLFLQRGASFAQARYAHATTSTCPGHAVILTGSYGEVNGIIANEWYDTRSRPPDLLRRGHGCHAGRVARAGRLSTQVVRRHGRRCAADGDGRPEPGRDRVRQGSLGDHARRAARRRRLLDRRTRCSSPRPTTGPTSPPGPVGSTHRERSASISGGRGNECSRRERIR